MARLSGPVDEPVSQPVDIGTAMRIFAPRLTPDPRRIPTGPQTVAELTTSYAHPEMVALVDGERIYTYHELNKTLNAACAHLTGLGLQPGDRIATSSTKDGDMVIAFLASQRLGLVWMGINPTLVPTEVEYQLKDAEASVFLTDAAIADRLRGQLNPAHTPRLFEDSSPDGWRAALTSLRDSAAPEVDIDPHAPAAIAYTSGTTGQQKGAVHSQHSIMTFPAAGHFDGRKGHWLPKLRRGVTVPLTILNGMIFGPLVALYDGGTYVCVDRRDAVGVAEAIQRYRIDTINTVGATLYDLLTKPEIHPRSLSSLRYAAAGGAPITPELKQMFRDRFGSELVEDYGLTESPCSLAGTTSSSGPQPTGCVGQSFPHIEVQALDSDGAQLPAGETGELAARAVQSGPWKDVYTAMLGYWNRPESTTEAIKDGWLRTGDMGYVDRDGSVHVVGRSKDTILRGGANIYPAEIEQVLVEDDRIESAVVLGAADPRLGEVPVAYLQLRDGVSPDEVAGLRAHLVEICANRLAKYKMPQSWFLVDEIPRNAILKVDKHRLRTTAARTLD